MLKLTSKYRIHKHNALNPSFHQQQILVNSPTDFHLNFVSAI